MNITIGHIQTRGDHMRFVEREARACASAWDLLYEMRFNEEPAYRVACGMLGQRLYEGVSVAGETESVLIAIEDARREVAPKPPPAPRRLVMQPCNRHYEADVCTCGT